MERIGRYQILNEIGRGAMGVVYRAQDPAIGRIIAIKTIRLTDLTDTDERQRLRERLFREAQSAGILSHPNIVTIYDIAEENGQACIFMEFVNGPSLEALLASKEPPDKQTFLDIFRQTAAALDYAHKKGIVHRDIKPANIMFKDDGQAKITDFGVAKILSQQMTLSGGITGTPNYMSPEQVQGLTVDGRADQFGLAVIAYELLTGEKPFVGDYLPTLLYKIVREDPHPPQRFNPTLGPAVENVLRKGLAKDPQGRYPNCSEFVAALIEACNTSPDWMPVPRGSSQTMATVAGMAPFDPRAPGNSAGMIIPQRPSAAATVPPRSPGISEPERNPLIKGVIWVLVGIGLVGLVLLGAQRFFFNPPPVVVAEQTQAAAQEQTQSSDPRKPSPVQLPDSVTRQTAENESSRQLPGDHAPEPERGQAEPPKPVTAPKLPTPERAAETAAVEPRPGPERPVQILTDPPGANVLVDGDSSKVCRAPCMLSLTIGRHTLATQLAGYRPYPRVFNVPAESDLFLKLAQVSGTLSITSTPTGASIQINGEPSTRKTPSTFAVQPGTYHVRVVRNGVPAEFDVQVRDGEFQTRDVNFP